MTCCLSQNKSVEAAAGELIQSSNSQNTQTHPILEAQALVAPFFRLFRQILNSSSFVLGQKEWMAVPPASPLTKPSIWLNQQDQKQACKQLCLNHRQRNPLGNVCIYTCTFTECGYGTFKKKKKKERHFLILYK